MVSGCKDESRAVEKRLGKEPLPADEVERCAGRTRAIGDVREGGDRRPRKEIAVEPRQLLGRDRRETAAEGHPDRPPDDESAEEDHTRHAEQPTPRRLAAAQQHGGDHQREHGEDENRRCLGEREARQRRRARQKSGEGAAVQDRPERPDAQREEERCAHVGGRQRAVGENHRGERAQHEGDEAAGGAVEAAGPEKDGEAERRAEQCHEGAAATEHGHGVIADRVEELIPDGPDVGFPPGFAVAVRKGEIAKEHERQGGQPLGQVSVLRLQAVIVEAPIGEPRGDVGGFVEGRGLVPGSGEGERVVDQQQCDHCDRDGCPLAEKMSQVLHLTPLRARSRLVMAAG